MTTSNYDELNFDPQNTKQWLFRRLTGLEAEQALAPCEPGTFLIRKSGRREGSYVMSLRVKSNDSPVNHIYIDVDRGQSITYIFGSNRFQRIHLLLGYYARHEIPNIGVKLIRACPEINVERPVICKNLTENLTTVGQALDAKLQRRPSQIEVEERGILQPNSHLQTINTKHEVRFDRDQLTKTHSLNSNHRRNTIEHSYQDIGKFDPISNHKSERVHFSKHVATYCIVPIPDEDKCNVWATPNQLTNEEVLKIRKELNEFKKSMLVHSQSKQYTRFYT